MAAFLYVAVDAGGRERKGVLESDTARQVRQLLRDQALLPVSVTEVVGEQKQAAAEGSSGRQFSFKFQRGLSASDLSLVTRQLATLVKSALPLEEALLAVSQQTDKPKVRNTLLGVRSKVMEGYTLADSLNEFPNSFPELYRATVAASEHSGHLDAVLERLADYTENREELRSRTLGALLYPVMLFVVCVAIVFFLLVSVVPKVVEVFRNSEAELPLLTQALIAGSDFMRAYGLFLVIGIGLGLWLFSRWLRVESNRRRWHELLLRLPLLGKIVRGSNTARFARTLSTLTASTVPVLEALRISGEVVTNLPMKAAVADAAIRVREGAPIGKSLGASRLFPPMMIHLISSGESSGELDTLLERAAHHQERELDTLLQALVGLLGPLMILVMGGLVLVIVLAMLLPIFELNQLVK
ncbi:MAG: type II secretion system inner membrane protein GspF [Gammaproteobacteria bacterium]|nr:type II secretion system inner membrane protein GspF [Gammaproteobacteria bacterium]MDH4312480.1 type II secretion system inner membrane protein GspF [Gammaproteobacteria bacterium]MDH5271736.1 type II secretion system inner membrane protein GspF [Gammaproteobacteria bacterium]